MSFVIVLNIRYAPPVVSQPTMCTDLLQSLKIFTEFVIQGIGQQLEKNENCALNLAGFMKYLSKIINFIFEKKNDGALH